jgi:hypothetical protein
MQYPMSALETGLAAATPSPTAPPRALADGGSLSCRCCDARSAATETDTRPGVDPRGAVLTHCYAGVPSAVSFAQSVGATLIADLAGDGEIGDHGPLLLMVVVCFEVG